MPMFITIGYGDEEQRNDESGPLRLVSSEA